jgi:hypothetical protein
LIALEIPASVAAGEAVTVMVRHRLTEDLGEQLVHVTLKAGPEAKRVDRKVVKIAGEGHLEVTFDVPTTVAGNTVRFAAFLGEDHGGNLQYLQTAPIPVR